MTSPACPICRRPVQQDYRPFCSRRCARAWATWFGGAGLPSAGTAAVGSTGPGVVGAGSGEGAEALAASWSAAEI